MRRVAWLLMAFYPSLTRAEVACPDGTERRESAQAIWCVRAQADRVHGPFVCRDGDVDRLTGEYEDGVPAGLWTGYEENGEKSFSGAFARQAQAQGAEPVPVEFSAAGFVFGHPRTAELPLPCPRVAVRGGRLVTGSGFGMAFVIPSGVPTGEWRAFSTGGEVVAAGAFERGLRTGKWVTGRASQRTEVAYLSGREDGVRRVLDANGSVISETTMRAGLADGEQTEQLGDLTRRCTMKAGKNEGGCETRRRDGSLVKSTQYEAGLRHGLETQYYPDGTKAWEDTYARGVRSGPFRQWFESGALQAEGTWESNQLHGVLRTYYEDGQIQSKHEFARGERHGQQLDWGPDGRLVVESTSEKGSPIGRGRAWWPDGTPAVDETTEGRRLVTASRTWYRSGQLRRVVASDGQAETHWEFHPNGRLAWKGQYVQRRPMGTHRRWHPNGVLADVRSYGKQGAEGLAFRYWADGKPRVVTHHRGGRKIGSEIEWYENGQLRSVAQYDAEGRLTGHAVRWYRDASLASVTRYTNGYELLFSNADEPTTDPPPTLRGVLRAGRSRIAASRVARCAPPMRAVQVRSAYGDVEQGCENSAGRRHGRWVAAFANGTRAYVGTYVDGVEDGAWARWLPSGELEEQYHARRGKKHGRHRRYFPSGNLMQQHHYEEGTLVGVSEVWNDRGDLEQTLQHAGDGVRAVVDVQRPLGGTSERFETAHGVRDGSFERFHGTGGVRALVGRHAMGVKVGTWREYDETGRWRLDLDYVDGAPGSVYPAGSR